jgi:hypothetical protein
LLVEHLSAYYWVLVATNVLGLASFTYISLLLTRLTMLLGRGGRWEYPAGFAFLGLSHAWTIIAVQDVDPRLALAAYTATSSFALAGFTLLLLPRGHGGGKAYAVPPVLVPLLFDLMAALTGIMAATTRFDGYARHLVLIVSLTYMLRGAGTLLLPSNPGVIIIMAAELARAVAAASLATAYAVAALRGR